MTEEEKIICKQFLDDADKTHSCNEYKLLMALLEQESKIGHWKHDRANVRCSNCGRGYKEAFGRTSAITYNFCPNCGADMREVNNGNN